MRVEQVENWIFVTGAPRSGTTFAGLVLSTPLSVDYIHEPFNPDCGVPGAEIDSVYLRAGVPHEAHYRALIERVRSYRFRLKTGYYPTDTTARRLAKRVVGSRGPFYLRCAKLNPFRRAVVLKDPTACLATEYLATEYGFKPLVLLRHPAAFVASCVRIGADGRQGLAALAAQHELVADYFDGETGRLLPATSDPVAHAAALWRAIYGVLLCQARRVGSAVVMTHEELSADPVTQFCRLYDGFGLPWSGRVERRIRRLTGSGNRVEAARGRVQDFRRDSAKLLELRLTMLTPAQRRAVFDIASGVADDVYPRESYLL